jgi:hypothetical protein
MNELNVKNLIAFLKENLGEVYGDMLQEAEDGLNKVTSRLQYSPWKNETEALENILNISQMLSLFPEGVDTHLTAPLEKFGIANLGRTANPADGDPDKEGLAYLIYAAIATGHMQDLTEILDVRYGVEPGEEAFEYADRIAHFIRWNYDGDSDLFFEELDNTPPQFKFPLRLAEVEMKLRDRENNLRGWQPPKPF